MLRNRQNNRRRVEELLNEASQDTAARGGDSDVNKYEVTSKGSKFKIGEKINEIDGQGRTITSMRAEVDDHGRVFGLIKDVVVCKCGCKLSLNAHKIYRCFYCKSIICPIHSIRWLSKKLTFCKKGKCYAVGRMLQLGYYSGKSVKFTFNNLFGLDVSEQPPSLDGRSVVIEHQPDEGVEKEDEYEVKNMGMGEKRKILKRNRDGGYGF